jgi:putative ABC transport system substrate-binding protein
MKRREFITLVGGAVAALPIPAGAQQNDRIRRIGLLLGATEQHDPESQARIMAFRHGLEALGWTEGRNVSGRFAVRPLGWAMRPPRHPQA